MNGHEVNQTAEWECEEWWEEHVLRGRRVCGHGQRGFGNVVRRRQSRFGDLCFLEKKKKNRVVVSNATHKTKIIQRDRQVISHRKKRQTTLLVSRGLQEEILLFWFARGQQGEPAAAQGGCLVFQFPSSSLQCVRVQIMFWEVIITHQKSLPAFFFFFF